MEERPPVKYTLSVQNFQSLKNVALEVEGLTVLFGAQSNIGKSSFVRALDGMLFGGCSKENIRHGATAMSISLDWEGHHIGFRKGLAENDYEVDGVIYKKVGREVPPSVAELGFRGVSLKDLEVNLQIRKQFDKAFPLVLAPSDMGKVVGALVQTEKVYSASKEVLSDSSRVRIKMGKSEALIAAKDREVRALSFIDGLSVQIEGMDSDGVQKLQERFDKARSLVVEKGRIIEEQTGLDSLLNETEVDEVSVSKFTLVRGLLRERRGLAVELKEMVLAVEAELDDESVIRNVTTLQGLVREKRALCGDIELMTAPLSVTLPSEDLVSMLLEQKRLVGEMRTAIKVVEAVETEMKEEGVEVCPRCEGVGTVPL